MNNHSNSQNDQESLYEQDINRIFDAVAARTQGTTSRDLSSESDTVDADDEARQILEGLNANEEVRCADGSEETAKSESVDEEFTETELHVPEDLTLPVSQPHESTEDYSGKKKHKKGHSKTKKSFFQQFSFGEGDFKGASSGVTFSRVIGGDILTNDFFRRQVRLIVLLVIFAIAYISNRYSFQQEMIEIDRLKKELTDIKYDALTRSSELTEKSRQSHIQEYISEGGSTLQTATQPPYLIK